MKIILQGKPVSTNHVYKYTHRGVYMTSEGKALKELYQWQAKEQYKGPLLTRQFFIRVVLYFPDNRKRDWDNWHKLSMDALNGIVWHDDSQIIEATVRKMIDKEFPRIEIKIQL